MIPPCAGSTPLPPFGEDPCGQYSSLKGEWTQMYLVSLRWEDLFISVLEILVSAWVLWFYTVCPSSQAREMDAQEEELRESWKETSLLANSMMPWALWRSRSNIKWKVREPASWRREGRGHTSRERRRQEGTGMMGSRGSLMSFLLKPRKSFFLKSKGTGWIRRLGLTDTHYSI